MNRLKFIVDVPVGYREAPKGKYRCACKRIIVARKNDVSRNQTKSCGCLKKELLSERRRNAA